MAYLLYRYTQFVNKDLTMKVDLALFSSRSRRHYNCGDICIIETIQYNINKVILWT